MEQFIQVTYKYTDKMANIINVGDENFEKK